MGTTDEVRRAVAELVAARPLSADNPLLRAIHGLLGDMAALHWRLEAIAGDVTCMWAQPEAIRAACHLNQLAIERTALLQDAFSAGRLSPKASQAWDATPRIASSKRSKLTGLVK